MGTIAFRRDSASDWTSANPTLLVGELGIETDTLKIKVGDGTSAWNDRGYIGWNDPPFVILSARGTVAGILAGNNDNSINKFSFTSDGDSTDHGNLSASPVGHSAGLSDIAGGYAYVHTSYGPNAPSTNIDKFAVASNTTATAGAASVVAARRTKGVNSPDKGYIIGGHDVVNIERFPFAAGGSATDSGDLVGGTSAKSTAPAQSVTVGYVTGGTGGPGTLINVIQKFPFAAEGNATDVGDLTNSVDYRSGGFSDTHGYASGGGGVNVINKYSFASDGNATDSGDLTTIATGGAGSSSSSHVYTSAGGDSNFASTTDTIDKFATATDSNATDVGNVVAGAGYGYAGTQH